MRQKLIGEGAKELSYEIREIVNKADQVQAAGQEIFWENIGDPIQKHWAVPQWIKEITSDLLLQDDTYGYCHSQGIPETRKFLAQRNNSCNGVQITEEDILFFNGLGDAIAKIYQFILPTSRIIGPSPAYSTHSSGEGAHANAHPLTYKLDPDNNWYPDMEDLTNQVKYNPNIVGILIINPDNPTGMVYPLEILKKIVNLAREYKLFIISDEIYGKITYNGARAYSLAEIIEDVPGIAMKGVSKELPWPGARCGWTEFYNRDKDAEFNKLFNTLLSAKMLEVCSTKMPQMAIPKIMSDARYQDYINENNKKIGRRAEIITSYLKDVPHITFNPTFGAFYNTIIFKTGLLTPDQSLKIENQEVKKILDNWLTPEMSLDRRFVYYLLAAKGVCVVPISSFSSELQGFRVTLLEENEEILHETFGRIKEALMEYFIL